MSFSENSDNISEILKLTLLLRRTSRPAPHTISESHWGLSCHSHSVGSPQRELSVSSSHEATHQKRPCTAAGSFSGVPVLIQHTQDTTYYAHYWHLYADQLDPGVAFMCSSKQREIWPARKPCNRLGRATGLKLTNCDLGPCTYNTEQMTNLAYNIDHRLLSQKGYTLGARTAPKLIPPEKKMKTPAPNDYQTDLHEPRMVSPSARPFGSLIKRFQETKGLLNKIPGPGTYDHDMVRNQKVLWHQSFGGRPVHLPLPLQQSTIVINTDKLTTTKEDKKFHRKLAYLQLYYD